MVLKSPYTETQYLKAAIINWQKRRFMHGCTCAMLSRIPDPYHRRKIHNTVMLFKPTPADRKKYRHGSIYWGEDHGPNAQGLNKFRLTVLLFTYHILKTE